MKEATEKLEAAKRLIERHKIPYMKTGKDNIDWAYEQIEQALSLLKDEQIEELLEDCQSQPKFTIEELKHLIWSCHYLINTGNSKEASELIIEKLNPEALKCRPQPKPEQSGFVKELRTAVNRYRIGQVDVAADWAIDTIEKAAARIEALQAENQQLTERIKELESLYSAATKALNSQIEKGGKDADEERQKV